MLVCFVWVIFVCSLLVVLFFCFSLALFVCLFVVVAGFFYLGFFFLGGGGGRLFNFDFETSRNRIILKVCNQHICGYWQPNNECVHIT